MTEQLIRETTLLRAEVQNGSVDTRIEKLPAILKEKALETKHNIRAKTSVPVSYHQLLIMAIRRGLAVLDNELTAEYNPDQMDQYIAEAQEGEKEAFDYITNQNNQ